MHIICDGMQRSGSTWSFNVAKGLLAHCFPEDEIYSGYEEDIAGFMASVPHAAKHVVLKSHLLDPVGKALARSGMAKMIYTWRPLPDAAASFLSMFGGDFEHVFLVITNSLVVYRFHLRNKNALMVGFDEMMQTPQETIGRIASYLNLDPSRTVITDLARKQSLEEVRKRLAQIESMPDDTPGATWQPCCTRPRNGSPSPPYSERRLRLRSSNADFRTTRPLRSSASGIWFFLGLSQVGK
jgi:hypothetical protein